MKKLALIVAAIFAAVAAGIATSAVVTQTASTPIQACVGKIGGVVRIVASATQCNVKLETPLSWNSEGRAGMDGAPGLASTVPGPKGDKGDKGDPGQSVTVTVTVPVGQGGPCTSDAMVNCYAAQVIPITATCSQTPSGSQICLPFIYDKSVTSNGDTDGNHALMAIFDLDKASCANGIVHFFKDGVDMTHSSQIGPLGGFIDNFRADAEIPWTGAHQLGIEIEGLPGGCNDGTILAVNGTLTLKTFR